MRALRGPIAQLGERRVRNAEVVSSILIRSTTHSVQNSLLRFERDGLFCFVRRVGRVWFVQDEAIGCGRLAACRTNDGGSATAAVRSFLLDRSMSQRKQTESSLLNPGRFKLTAALKIRQVHFIRLK